MTPRTMLSSVLLALGCIAAPVSAADAPKTFAPAGAGPHPAVLFLSGCSGFVAIKGVNLYEERAQELSQSGYLVVFVDYLAKRGAKTCAQTVSRAEVGRDLMDVVRWVRSQPTVDPKRVYAIGWSYGGGGLMAALATQPAGDLTLTKAVAIYPDCREVQPWKAATPTLVLMGGLDEVAPASRCSPVLGVPGVKAVTYPEARHAFDLHSLAEKETYQFGTIGYAAVAAQAAKAEIAAFLK